MSHNLIVPSQPPVQTTDSSALTMIDLIIPVCPPLCISAMTSYYLISIILKESSVKATKIRFPDTLDARAVGQVFLPKISIE